MFFCLEREIFWLTDKALKQYILLKMSGKVHLFFSSFEKKNIKCLLHIQKELKFIIFSFLFTFLTLFQSPHLAPTTLDIFDFKYECCCIIAHKHSSETYKALIIWKQFAHRVAVFYTFFALECISKKKQKYHLYSIANCRDHGMDQH